MVNQYADYSSNTDYKVGDRFTFNTGRDYSENGQIINIDIIGYGYFLGDDKHFILRLEDMSRGLAYYIDVPANSLTPFNIVRVYDAPAQKMIAGSKQYYSVNEWRQVKEQFKYLDHVRVLMSLAF